MNFQSKISNSSATTLGFCLFCWHACSGSCSGSCSGGCTGSCGNGCNGNCGNNCTDQGFYDAET